MRHISPGKSPSDYRTAAQPLVNTAASMRTYMVSPAFARRESRESWMRYQGGSQPAVGTARTNSARRFIARPVAVFPKSRGRTAHQALPFDPACHEPVDDKRRAFCRKGRRVGLRLISKRFYQQSQPTIAQQLLQHGQQRFIRTCGEYGTVLLKPNLCSTECHRRPGERPSSRQLEFIHRVEHCRLRGLGRRRRQQEQCINVILDDTH